MDFQREVLMQVTRKNKEDIRKTAFISDEYQEYITKQLISYNSYNDKKMGMLILDVKGNYYDFVRKEAIKNGRLQDLVCIDISGGTYYNPIDKTELSSDIIAGRLKEILLLFLLFFHLISKILFLYNQLKN